MAGRYREGRPYPHMIFDDFFPPEVIEELQSEIPDFVSVDPITKCSANATVCRDDYAQQGKGAINNELFFGPMTRAVFAFMRSPLFVIALQRLTRLNALIPDPQYLGAGRVTGALDNICQFPKCCAFHCRYPPDGARRNFKNSFGWQCVYCRQQWHRVLTSPSKCVFVSQR